MRAGHQASNQEVASGHVSNTMRESGSDPSVLVGAGRALGPNQLQGRQRISHQILPRKELRRVEIDNREGAVERREEISRIVDAATAYHHSHIRIRARLGHGDRGLHD